MRTSIFFFITIGALGFILKSDEEKVGIDSNLLSATVIDTIDSIFDNRDSNWYKVVRVDSLYWFNENLSFKSPDSREIVLSGKSKASSVRVYSFRESKSVCPSGWRLPTTKDFDHLVSTVFDTSFLGFVILDDDWKSINNNSFGFNFDHTGFLHKSKIKSRESFNLWLDDMEIQNAYHVHIYDTDRKDKRGNLTVFRHTHEKYSPKKNRKFAIRCVCEAITQKGLGTITELM